MGAQTVINLRVRLNAARNNLRAFHLRIKWNMNFPSVSVQKLLGLAALVLDNSTTLFTFSVLVRERWNLHDYFLVARVGNDLEVFHQVWLDFNALGVNELLCLSVSWRDEEALQLINTVIRIFLLFLTNELLKPFLDFLRSLTVFHISADAFIEGFFEIGDEV
jgi:hypothetical protein